MGSSMEEQQRIVDEMNGEGLVVAGDDPRDFLDAVWQDPRQPMARRVKVALELMPYHHPKLSVTAHFGDEASFGALLDKAIARSQAPPKLIEHNPHETSPTVQWSGPISRPVRRLSNDER